MFTVVIMILSVSLVHAQQKITVEEYILTYKDVAMDKMKKLIRKYFHVIRKLENQLQ